MKTHRMSPKILIVDDHEIVRVGIRTLLSQVRAGWEISGEATNAEEALSAVQRLQPDIVILDVTMPGASGLDAARQMKKMGLPARILMFSMHDSERIATEARDAGAEGYVLKSEAARDLVVAIERILGGGTFFRSSSPKPT
jgi:DNA-binding NarL/FixJ family response regulator